MLNTNTLQKFNEINLENDLKIAKNNLTYDYNSEIWTQIKDLYNLIKEAIWYIKEETPSQFISNIEKSINILFDIINRIKNTQDSLWHDFERQKQWAINSITSQLNEIFTFQDQSKLLITLNYLKNDYFAKNTKDLTSNMFNEWASWKNEWVNKFIELIEEKAKKAWEELQKAEKSTEVIEQVKTWKGFEEFENHVIQLTSIYEKYKKSSFCYILWLSITLLIFVLSLKFWWFVSFDNFYYDFNKIKYINFPYVIYQTLFWILVFSLVSYLLKLSVDEYKIYSNLLISLDTKSSIIKSYLLFLKYWDNDNTYIEINKLVIEKTLESLYKDWTWTHFGKEKKLIQRLWKNF